MTDNTQTKGEAVDIQLLILIKNYIARVRLDLAIQNGIDRSRFKILNDLVHTSPQFLEFIFPTFDGETIQAHALHLMEVLE